METTSVNIFEEGNNLRESWAKWVNVGDAVQGTYVDCVDALDPRGNAQKVYKFRQPSGEVVNVGVKLTKKKFIEMMAKQVFGQIIGIKYTRDLPPRDATESPTKILEIFANPTVRDEKWLHEQTILNSMRNNEGGQAVEGPDESHKVGLGNLGPANVPVTPESQLKAAAPFVGQASVTANQPQSEEQRILEIARMKFLISEPDALKVKIMESTGLAFIPMNFNQILLTLSK